MADIDKEFDTDVIVVGTGPMGAATALSLAANDVRVLAISKFGWLADTPRAHITNLRTMEVLRAFGAEEDAKMRATPWQYMGDTLFTTSLAGPEIARLRTWGTGDERFGDYLESSPCTMLDVPQTIMEPILVDHAAKRGAQVAFDTRYLGHEQDDEGVTVRLTNHLSAHDFELRAKYLVGADGANSKVFKDLSLELEGVPARAGTVYAQFTADLSAYVAHRPSILYWIMNPAANFGEIGMGLLRAVKPWRKWIAGWGFDMAKGEPDLSQDTALAQIRSLVGDPEFECDITQVSPWYVNQQYAPVYSKGRVICGGDAVHRHPASSGLGSNTSIQDAYALGWKLAFAVKGWGSQSLVDSYSHERAPIGEQIVARANQSRVDYAPMREAVLQPEAENPVAASIARITDPSPEGAKARDALAQALELKNYEFNAQGVEMNQRYASSAVIEDIQDEPETFARDKDLYVQSTTRPGAKIPHAWLVNGGGLRVSTLDLVSNHRMTLVTGLAGQIWASAVDELAAPYLGALVIGSPEAQDLYCNWRRIREIPETGALLVRPDAVIAWRKQTAPPSIDEAAEELRSALEQILR